MGFAWDSGLARADWRPSRDIASMRSSAPNPTVAVDGRGASVAVWTDQDSRILASERPAGGDFGMPVPVAVMDSGGYPPVVAAGEAGERVVLWQVSSPASAVAVRAFGSDGRLGPVQMFPADKRTSDVVNEVGLDFDAHGEAFASWDDNSVVRMSVRPPGGQFGAPVAVSPEGSISSPLAVDGAGVATLIWLWRSGPRGTSRERAAIESRTATAGGQLGPIQVLAEGPASALAAPRVAADRTGDVTAVWLDTSQRRSRVMVAAHHPGQAFVPAQSLIAGGFGLPDVAMNPAGDTVVRRDVTVRFRPAGGDWGSPERVPVAFINEHRGAMAIGADGTVAVAGEDSTDADFAIVSLRPRGRHFGIAQALGTNPSFTGADPSVAVDSSGIPIAIFVRTALFTAMSTNFISTSVFDRAYRAPPVIWADVFGEATDIGRVRKRRGVGVQVSVSEPRHGPCPGRARSAARPAASPRFSGNDNRPRDASATAVPRARSVGATDAEGEACHHQAPQRAHHADHQGHRPAREEP